MKAETLVFQMVTPQAMRFISLHFVTRCYMPIYKGLLNRYIHYMLLHIITYIVCYVLKMCYFCVALESPFIMEKAPSQRLVTFLLNSLID